MLFQKTLHLDALFHINYDWFLLSDSCCENGIGTAPYPLFDERGREVDVVEMKVEIDEKILREIASLTGGEYFRATNKQTLQAVYDKINTLEKSTVEVENRTLFHDLFLPFVLWALVALLLEFIIEKILLKRIP